MKATALRLLVVVLAALALVPACRRSSSGGRPFDIAGAGVDKGNPVLAPAPGYAGSDACASCHRGPFDDWLRTFHNLSMRETDREGAAGEAVVGDANGNGQDDFRDGLDLGTDLDFAVYGGNAPRLLFAAGEEYPHKVQVGAAVYDVWRTIGGNGLWHQRYLTRLSTGVYVLPVEYDEVEDDWKPYDPGTWYDGGNAPRFADVAAAAAGIDRGHSFDLNCAGCHATGFEIAFDGASGHYASGYEELTVGCEACHGPGQAHVDSLGNPGLILNPEGDLLDGSVNGILAADLVCGRCHVKGAGGIPAGGAHPTGYPWLTGNSTFPPGNTNLADYYEVTSDPADFWRYKDNYMGFGPSPGNPADDSFLAVRHAELQYPDFVAGVHGPRQPWSPTCFSCHDPHSRDVAHQIRGTIVENATTFTGVTTENNKLCLACHNGHGDWAGLTPADVQGIAGDTAPAAVVGAVVDHMKNRAAMPIDAGDYAPVSTGAGRCTLCHQVKTALAASYTADAAGNLVGDIHGHTFEVVWPNVTELTKGVAAAEGITNGCSSCHPTGPGDVAADAIAEWARDSGDADGTFHADAPANFQTGVANPERDGGVACVACHTTDGFIAIQVEGTSIHDLTGAGDAAARTAFVAEGRRRDKGITCEACHGKGPTGTFGAGDNPTRFPKGILCGKCHNNETVVFPDWTDHGEIVRHPQREMMLGADGGEVPGAPAYGDTAHTTLFGQDCTNCHYRSGSARAHDFEPTIPACQACHPGLASFNRLAGPGGLGADYDGDTVLEGIQDEVKGCLERLKDAILAAGLSDADVTITFDGEYFLIGRGGASPVAPDEANSDLLDPSADQEVLRGIFNYYWVEFDGSFGVHNARYALELVQQSWIEITGQAWPGVER